MLLKDKIALVTRSTHNIGLGDRARSRVKAAEAAVFLSSDKASYITNTILSVDGGRINSVTSGSAR
jgi:NAD(P)-dependent dehydrogenase (short-subunit alcohol dehydrogenase family)